MEQYNFKKFTKKGAKLTNYSISLTGSYSFGFNSGFYDREGIRNYKKVVLYYDPIKKAVAFQFTNEESTEGAFTIIHSNVGKTGSVTAKSFIMNNSLNIGEYRGKKIPQKIHQDEIGDLYVIHILQN